MPAVYSLQPASWQTRATAAYQGQYGATTWGKYLVLPGATDYYVYETHDDGSGRYVGVDPGDYVAALSGYTGIEAQHPAGDRTAAQRATTIAAAIDAATAYSVAANGATVEVTGVSGGSVGGMWAAANQGILGCRRNTSSFAGAVISDGVGGIGTSPSGRTVIVKSIRVYVDTTGANMRAAVYTGGSTTRGDYAATTLQAEVVIPTGSTGWVTVPLTPAQVFSMASATVYRCTLKGAGGIAAPGYRVAGSTGVDFVDLLEVYTTGIDPDPAVAWPASLNGVTNTNTFTSPPMIGLEYVDNDGTANELETRWGTHVPDPTTLLQQSSLTIPDAGGADLFMGQMPPDVLGLELRAHAVGYGEDHATQLRLFVAQGGSVGDAEGVTILWQDRSTGSTTQAWVETAIPGNVAVDRDQVLWWGVRNNDTGVTFRFAFNADFDDASPDDNPSDFVAASEWEAFNSSDGAGVSPGAHETDPDVALVSPFSSNTGAIQENTNHPAAYLVLVVPADTVQDVADAVGAGCWLLTGVVCDRDS